MKTTPKSRSARGRPVPPPERRRTQVPVPHDRRANAASRGGSGTYGEQSTWEIITTTYARENFSRVVNRVAFGHERILVGRRGEGEVAMIPMEDLRLVERLEDQLDLKAVLDGFDEMEKAGGLEEFRRHGGTVPLEEFRRRNGL